MKSRERIHRCFELSIRIVHLQLDLEAMTGELNQAGRLKLAKLLRAEAERARERGELVGSEGSVQ
jgi:hypothetical protein